MGIIIDQTGSTETTTETKHPAYISGVFCFSFNLAKLRLKPTNNDSVFLDFRVYRAFVNTEIKEHGDDLKIAVKLSF